MRDEAYKIETREIDGYTVRVECHTDPFMGPPWEEHEGHGDVSEWTSRDKKPGEWVLCSERGSHRYYDHAATIKQARLEGWGLGDEAKAKLAQRLGKPVESLTKGEITAESVRLDFEHLKAWCNDEWYWVGYTTTITDPDGEEHDGASVWGYDDKAYMLDAAWHSAECDVARLLATANETQMALCYP